MDEESLHEADAPPMTGDPTIPFDEVHNSNSNSKEVPDTIISQTTNDHHSHQYNLRRRPQRTSASLTASSSSSESITQTPIALPTAFIHEPFNGRSIIVEEELSGVSARQPKLLLGVYDSSTISGGETLHNFTINGQTSQFDVNTVAACILRLTVQEPPNDIISEFKKTAKWSSLKKLYTRISTRILNGTFMTQWNDVDCLKDIFDIKEGTTHITANCNIISKRYHALARGTFHNDHYRRLNISTGYVLFMAASVGHALTYARDCWTQKAIVTNLPPSPHDYPAYASEAFKAKTVSFNETLSQPTEEENLPHQPNPMEEQQLETFFEGQEDVDINLESDNYYKQIQHG
jgi:hypothetical protein